MVHHITRKDVDKAIEELYREKAKIRQFGGNIPPRNRPPVRPAVPPADPRDVHISIFEWMFAIFSILIFGILGIIPHLVGILFAVAANFFIGMSISKGIRTAGKGVGKAVDVWKKL